MATIIDGNVYDIRFRHEREWDGDSPKPNGGRTVAYVFSTDGERIEAYANCSLKDTYNKKLGRIISGGRLFKLLGLNTKEACKLQSKGVSMDEVKIEKVTNGYTLEYHGVRNGALGWHKKIFITKSNLIKWVEENLD